jgi:hypothetical protein
LVSRQRRSDPSRHPARRQHRICACPRRTSSPLLPNLIFGTDSLGRAAPVCVLVIAASRAPAWRAPMAWCRHWNPPLRQAAFNSSPHRSIIRRTCGSWSTSCVPTPPRTASNPDRGCPAATVADGVFGSDRCSTPSTFGESLRNTRPITMRFGPTFRSGRMRPADGPSSGSATLSRIRSLADYTIAMLESSFRKRQHRHASPSVSEGQVLESRLRISHDIHDYYAFGAGHRRD